MWLSTSIEYIPKNNLLIAEKEVTDEDTGVITKSLESKMTYFLKSRGYSAKSPIILKSMATSTSGTTTTFTGLKDPFYTPPVDGDSLYMESF